MTEYVYTINDEPTPWATHKGYGKHAYSTHTKAKHSAQWQLKAQHCGRPLIEGAVRVDFFFEMPIPKYLEKKIRRQIADAIQPYGKCSRIWCTKRPDATNLRKFAEDCLVGPVLFDDNLVVAGETQKYYAGGKPKTIIVVQEM